MKVLDKRDKDFKCKINKLVIGATFIFDDELFMILDFKIQHVIVVSLETGEQTDFTYAALVTPVFVECNIVKNVEV